MKKILLATAAAALIAVSASAQVYVGGSAGAWRNYDANKTQISIMPEAGYSFNDNWAVGMSVGYQYDYLNKTKVNSYVFNPYVRWTYAKLGSARLFLDGTCGYTSSKVKDGATTEDYEFGIKPGLAIPVSDNVSFVTHMGFLGYRDYDNNVNTTDSGFGFSLSGYDLSFGFYYNF